MRRREAEVVRLPLERFTVSGKRQTALSLCFDAIPDGKPFHTFPGIALAKAGILFDTNPRIHYCTSISFRGRAGI
ncbi:MAG: hypothetical protein EOQ30_19110 [Mesorhizobium sp.]|nr:MAG: hypothetical protein EOQ29_30585 [Mesorhizobium sp.]RWA81290.1 MAG: hypothetical protein EOQ30_19110 [Mesorhizobium sp.]RWB20417.1 MAG: hypothetical protein EOQ40_15240 [Mesorhizobium sp.]